MLPSEVYHFGVGAWLSEHLQLERSASSEIPEEVDDAMESVESVEFGDGGFIKGVPKIVNFMGKMDENI